MFELHTKRLRLVALDLENLRLELEEPEKMERNLGLRTGHAVLEGELREAVEKMLERVVVDQANYLWNTDWKIVLKEENRIIGGLCFKGPPNESHEAEIGYGIYPEYQRKGYMTEALQEIARWTFQHPQIVAILAETEKSNIPSQRVLEKIGFTKGRETELFLWWKLERHRFFLPKECHL